MQEWIQAEKLAKGAGGVDAFAKRVVAALVESPPGDFSAAVEFSPDRSDPCSVYARVHRRRLHLEFVHVLTPAPYGGDLLAGRFNILNVEANGDRTGRDGTVTLYPPEHLVFEPGSNYKLPEVSDDVNKAGVRDAFAHLVLKVAQRELGKIDR